MKAIKALAFHAERLHDNRVWCKVVDALDDFDRVGAKATFFVYPHRSVLEGKDISDRVRELQHRGHEIGQHTHFYSHSPDRGLSKSNDLSPQNIRACILRDLTYLGNLGVSPVGFSAGGWIATPDVFETLTELGFKYDCSSRYVNHGPSGLVAHNYWLRQAEILHFNTGPILCIPTLCSLGQWFRGGFAKFLRLRSDQFDEFQLIYLHDYDLLRLVYPALLKCLIRLNTCQSVFERAKSTLDRINILGE